MAHTICQQRHSPSATRITPSTMMPPSMSVAQDPQSYLSPCQITPNRKVQSSSPSYFGFHSNEGATFLSDANQPHSHQNWSPPSSAVRSTVGVSPNMVPVERNPDFELFRRQSQEKGFNLSSFGGSARSSNHNAARARPDRTISQTSIHDGRRTPPENGSARIRQTSFSQINAERSSPKRVLSPSADSSDRRASPASFAHDESVRTQEQPRFKLPLDNISGAFGLSNTRRAGTLPPQSSDGPDSEQQVLATPQHIMTLLESNAEDVLLLDLRVSTQYGESHIDGALNLCIPTTLLKRPSFNVQKLTEIFKDEDQKMKFEKWRNSKYIVVYDASSALLRDAQTCLNTIKKFRTEGYSGTCCIIKGGFLGFSKRYPGQISYAQSENASSHGLENDGPDMAPVVGGCPMPGLDKAMNPFFGNIRQNMDLIGGVGQIALQHPPNASAEDESGFPGWLNVAASEHDEGKSVSQKFEQIERREKKRMEEALSGDVTWEKSHSSTQAAKVQIAGIEKGAKNRYNNIWPFEHSRVKLQGVPRAECDYFNANYIQSALSYKRYISTQAPIPATFMDFWNVVWQQDVRVIVMLTAETEGQQVKAHNYWSEKQYGALRLEFLSEKRASLDLRRIRNHQKLRPHHQKRSSTVASSRSLSLALVDSKSEAITTDERITAEPASDETQPYVTVRRFTLTNERKPFEPMREVVQLQYSAWPDFGAPAHPAHLLGLVEQTDAVSRTINNNVSKSINRTDSVRSQLREPEARGTRPILVHCSAGCGRTGTFCTVDSVIDMLKRQFISREESAATKMDIDTTPKANRVQPMETPSKLQQKQTSPNGLIVNKDLGGPEGDWVHRDDVDLIEKTVEDFRHQRISMVQSLRQYVLCYESIMEWFVEGRRADNASK